jgi:hypothetical protein
MKYDFNTCINDGATAIYFTEAAPNERMSIVGNIIIDKCTGSCWGILGSGAAEGMATLNRWAPGATYERNLVVTPTPWLYGPAAQTRLEATMPADTTGFGATIPAPKP